MPETTLQCLSPGSARAVAEEAGGHEPDHCARADGSGVVLIYIDKRYPLDVAEWAFEHGHADDPSAAAVIAGL
jgi:hypothetical protein